MIEFSFFEHFYANIAQPCTMQSWEQFTEHMRCISDVEGYKPASDDYTNKQGLISAGIYTPEKPNRSNDNVIGWDIVMLDIDDGIRDINIIREHFKLFDYILYSSPNCTKAQLKLRVILRLDSRAPSKVLSQIWYACNQWCNGIVDAQTKDKSRLMYIPARYTNKGKDYNHIFEVNQGIALNWRGLIEKFPSPPEKDRYKRQNEMAGLKRKIYLQNKTAPSTDITSESCPFVYQRMIDEYRLTPAGSHHKMLYIFMLQICSNAKKIDYPLSIDELVDMARQLDDLDGGFYKDKKLYDSAKDALEYSGM